ncbi:recombinase family protein [Clostridium sp. ZBS4]|uniref:recombinase family protein n=1 Tax=Clostridium sp. ZBS4 TaxID=2949974 RepID=UPI00339067AD
MLRESDTLICTEVSRISRSTKQLCEIIELAKEKHLKLILGTFVLDCTKKLDVMTEDMLKMMGVFAELERNMISERVKSGMRNAQTKGKKIGQPATDSDAIPSIFYKHYPKYKNGEINKKEFSRLCNLSYPTIYKYLKILDSKSK